MTIAVEPGALVHLRDGTRGRKYRGERGRQLPAEKYSGKRTGPGACARRRAATGGKSTAAARPGKKEM